MKIDNWRWEWFDANLVVDIVCECGQNFKVESDRANEHSFTAQCPTCKVQNEIYLSINVELNSKIPKDPFNSVSNISTKPKYSWQ